jgi:GntR family transcriptional repressor for pyruvate dehydrogenase complex
VRQEKENIGFRTIQKMSVCEDIIEQIKELVRKNHYGLGSKLPSERELAEQLGVSRPSVREALRTLAIMGVLQTRHGSGTQVSESSENILRAPFEFLMILDQPTIFELYETRALVEVFLAGRAAERRTPADLAAIEVALHDMRENIANPARMTPANVQFHEAVAAAAHNTVLGRVMTCLHDGIRVCIETTQPAFRDMQVSYHIHQEIYDAIRQQEPAAARHAMSRHMEAAMETLQNMQANERRMEIYTAVPTTDAT